jgi:diguanylate cyclase (GGDEF)-like protein
MRYLYLLLAAALLCITVLPANAVPLDVTQQYTGPVGKHLSYLQESDGKLSLEEVMASHTMDRFTASSVAFLRFGLNSSPVWLRLEVRNNTSQPVLQRLSIERAWLDRLDFFVLKEQKLLQHLQTGDSLPFAQRPLNSRFFAFDHAYEPGTTTVYVRIESSEAMVLPVYFSTTDQFQSRETGKAYWYGILYGGLAALLIYNLVLFFNLGRNSYLFYALYLLSFLLANLAFTGHAYQFIWPEHPLWQKWSDPVLVVAFMLFGLFFAASFLDIKRHFPRLYKGISLIITGMVLLTTALILLDWQNLLVTISATLLLLFSVGMIILGLLSWRAGIPSAKYFLAASITHSSALFLSILIVVSSLNWGEIVVHVTEVAMLIDAILLAFALADQFRILQNEKLLAERLANIDPLTGMCNRRGFHDLINPLWNIGLRNHHHMSVILMDLDRFKNVNDLHGHAIGDKMLRRTASMLGINARAGDILARWGGEEFILFLPETSLEQATSIAERLRRALARLDTGIDGLKLTASFGVAHTILPGTRIEELIQQADSHLYRAKEMGRNSVYSADPSGLSEEMASVTP